MPYSATLFTTNGLNKLVNQAAHGFVAGQLVKLNVITFVLAQANSEASAEMVGMVSIVVDANFFWITQVGYVSALANGPYASGSLYYLSTTVAGALQVTRPTVVGEVVLPCFIADSNASDYFFTSVGDVIEPAIPFAWFTVVGDTAMAANSGYITNAGFPISLTLPVTATVGSIIKIETLSTNDVLIVQNALQSIIIVEESSTVGITGGLDLQTTNGVLAGSLTLICIVANTTWRVESGTGAWDPI